MSANDCHNLHIILLPLSKIWLNCGTIFDVCVCVCVLQQPYFVKTIIIEAKGQGNFMNVN